MLSALVSYKLNFPLLLLTALLWLTAGAWFSLQAQPASTPKPEYRIRKGDKLSVRFLYQPELNDAAIVVRPDGHISLPMVDEISVEGLTVRELKTELERAYREILLDPEITVSIVEFVPPRVFVGGQVAKPGSYELRAAQTLLQAVILAGGFTNDAHRKFVLHARPINARELKVISIDVTKSLKPGERMPDIQLQDGDYIFIPDSKLAKFTNVVNSLRAFVPGYGLQF